MKSSDWVVPRRGTGPARPWLKADHPRAIDRYIAYFGDRINRWTPGPTRRSTHAPR